MPGWPVMTILLIAAGTFILLNLLRNREETRRQRPPMRDGIRNEADDPRPRREPPLTDLDRFLQEVHRRRTSESAEAKPEPPRRPVPAPRVAPSASRRSSRAGERATSRSSAREEVIPLAIAVDTPADRPRNQGVPEPGVIAFPGSPVAPPTVTTIQRVGATGVKKRQDTSFLRFLSSRSSLRDAVILREIFDPPLCKREQPR
jgi:hypothetical protein